MFIVSTMNWQILAKIAGVGVVVGLALVVSSPHRMERIGTFFSSSNDVAAADERDNNYHIKNAMIALGTGGLLGRGIGKSIQATGYLPEAVNDSIFAIMGEIFGFAGTVCIIGLFGILLFRILRIASAPRYVYANRGSRRVWLAACTRCNERCFNDWTDSSHRYYVAAA